MRQFSPFQEVTKIPLLFSAQAHSVPPQTTSRARSLLPRAGGGEKRSTMPTLSPSPEVLDGEGGASQILFHSLCGAWGSWKSGIKQIKSMECQSKVFWRPINSSLEVGLAQHGGTPLLGAGRSRWGPSAWPFSSAARGISRSAGGKEHPSPGSGTTRGDGP